MYCKRCTILLMNTIPQIVAASNATADIAYYVCVVSFFIAGGVAIFLLWDRIQQHNKQSSKKAARIVKPTAKKTPAKKAASKVAPKKSAAKKAPAKKTATKKAPTKRTTKKK